jgi:serine-type D-Ala-D-Ala carboxypeptidase (penicillin-binding protein 5/6)
MEVRSYSPGYSPLKLTIVSTLIMAAMLAAGAPSAAAARHARRAKAAAAETAAVPLDKIHVLGDRPAPFGLDARAAIMIDARSGATLYAYNEHERIQPASLTKLMTFYLVLKALHQGRITPDTMVTVSEKAWRLSMNSTVSRMFLQVGQRVSINDLLFGLMVSSGNDAAVALAEYLGGSTDAFVEQMNQEAKELGLGETHFENPDGLPVPGMYSTAFDMVKLARALTQRFPDAFKYTSAKDFTFDKIHQPNFNALLFHDARVNGLKTGHVDEAGYHLVASAHADGMYLLSAVLGTPSATARRVDSEKLIDWAFRTFSSVQPDWHKTLPDRMRVYGGVANEVAVAPAEVPFVTVEHGQEGKVTLAGSFDAKYLVAPIVKGQRVGTMVLMVNGKPQSTIPMLATAAVARGGLFKRTIDRLRMRL